MEQPFRVVIIIEGKKMEPVKLVSLTYDTVTDALQRLKPGRALLYHTGSLMHDRKEGPAYHEVHGAAHAAYVAYTRGEVTLIQRKLKPLVFEYLAVRMAPPKKAANDNRRRKNDTGRPSEGESKPRTVVAA